MPTKQYLHEEQPYTEIGNDLLAAWQRAHGIDCGEACTMVGPDGVAIVIENAFSKAELLMAQQRRGGDLLTRYARGLLAQVCEEQAQRVTAVAERPVRSTAISLDPEAGWVMCVFKLGGRPAA